MLNTPFFGLMLEVVYCRHLAFPRTMAVRCSPSSPAMAGPVLHDTLVKGVKCFVCSKPFKLPVLAGEAIPGSF